ncbi:MAG TPA: hypothetical protein PLG34_13950 [Spirochaetota bacterium]|nr:hypothetical protein [Spirochaetota bacterium]
MEISKLITILEEAKEIYGDIKVKLDLTKGDSSDNEIKDSKLEASNKDNKIVAILLSSFEYEE